MNPRTRPAGAAGPTIEVAILVEDPAWGEEAALQPLVEAAVAAAAAALRDELPDETELSVVFTDDARIRDLNRDWRGKDTPTNVLSFPAGDPDEPIGLLLGDIVIARETTEREALDEGRPLAHHVTHLLVHGLLHLVGHDHEEDEEAEAMERLETAVLSTLGIPDPYAGTDPVADSSAARPVRDAMAGRRETKV